MRSEVIFVLTLLTACTPAKRVVSAHVVVPTELRSCPVPRALSAIRTTEMLADYANRVELAREVCADRLRRLNELIDGNR